MNIYVGNLAYEVNDDDLREAFAAYDEVTSAKVITDKFSGRSRGFRFVEMSGDKGTKEAIKEMEGKDLKGRAIKVNEARPRT